MHLIGCLNENIKVKARLIDVDDFVLVKNVVAFLASTESSASDALNCSIARSRLPRDMDTKPRK